MYKLHRISLHNWNLLAAQDIEIRGTTALIGATGIGKSSLLDALQVCLTGNPGRANLNSAASRKKRSERTVRDYCLGKTDENAVDESYRESCDSYIVLTFRREGTPEHFVTVGLALRANRAAAKEDTIARFVIPGLDFSLKEFADIVDDATGEVEVPYAEEMIRRLKRAGGTNYMDFPGSQTQFVAQYLGELGAGVGEAL